MAETRYTEQHEWIRVDGDEAVVGISKHAAAELNGVVFVELPEVGKTVAKGDELAVVESAKAASEVYAPASGEVIAVNDVLEGEPGKVDESPEDEAWFVKLKLTDASEVESLMDADAYKKHIEE
ncbi:glycine cleavage system protein GcvH [Marinicauda salina]|uniref:Glycine cleavage system H protein n=1 Tax=Marinicauda salina TaxID=2135793 RepID=A0A2U2BUI1_9PROT|nr:glycine cleavage system protein GcvH [Marinicauda salina]PWE17647.1 glycine cleavage system protein GcvH [Marinicauda salina]